MSIGPATVLPLITIHLGSPFPDQGSLFLCAAALLHDLVDRGSCFMPPGRVMTGQAQSPLDNHSSFSTGSEARRGPPPIVRSGNSEGHFRHHELRRGMRGLRTFVASSTCLSTDRIGPLRTLTPPSVLYPCPRMRGLGPRSCSGARYCMDYLLPLLLSHDLPLLCGELCGALLEDHRGAGEDLSSSRMPSTGRPR